MNNRMADSRSHTLLQSGHSPRRGNSQDRPAAGTDCTDCTGHSWVCILSWSAMICLTAAAAAAAAVVCSLNSQGREGHSSTAAVIWFMLQAQNSQFADKRTEEPEKNSLVSSQAQSQRFTTKSHSTLTLV